MRRFSMIAGAAALCLASGCATPISKVESRNPVLVFTSTKTADEMVACLVHSRVTGIPSVLPGVGYQTVAFSIENSVGMTFNVYPDAAGSRVEMRRLSAIQGSKSEALECK